MANVWVFGYGSLMWDYEDYNPIKIVDATLIGAHRSYNKKSIKSRGTPTHPGLVLGTEDGGKCKGKALLIDQKYVKNIDQREGAGYGYQKITTPTSNYKVKTDDSFIKCIAYISDPSHKDYIGDALTVEQKAQMAINSEKGTRGNSVDYIKDNYKLCKKNGIDDSALKEMNDEVERLEKEQTKINKKIFSKYIHDVEVYDSPGQYGSHNIDGSRDLIVGLTKEIRDELDLTGKWDNNEKVIVKNGSKELKLKAVQSDKRLSSGGTCKADNPANHCWITPAARKQLGVQVLKQADYCHRLNYPAFKKKFESVKIKKA